MPPKKVKRSRDNLPCVLTIAGSDSGGGAGIQADLKTFAALGVHGASAITCVTAQNPREVRSVQAIKPEIVRDQIEAVMDALRPEVLKTGMLYSAEIIQVVAEKVGNVKLVVDPVMISTSGALLLKKSAVSELKKLMANALVVTPNVQEAEFLLGRKLESPEDLRAGGREIHEMFGCAALMKGGHLPGLNVAIDFLFDGSSEWMFESPFVKGVSTHGTGCTYSAAIAAFLARGLVLHEAVGVAKEFISNAIARSYKTSGHFALNTEWNRA
ncbi:MAG TPA: bifunctional hydroxymethylpyrimidine kinase/phosphomethylpyrimidine kinase [Verrucomicrobiae bacterium]